MNRGLRDCLSVADWKRRIFIRAVTNTGGYEEMTRYLIDRVKNGKVLHPLLLQGLDEPAPRSTVLLEIY